MRLLLTGAILAAAAVPASASYLLTNGCRDGDYHVVHLEAANTDIVDVCTDEPPIIVQACFPIRPCGS